MKIELIMLTVDLRKKLKLSNMQLQFFLEIKCKNLVRRSPSLILVSAVWVTWPEEPVPRGNIPSRDVGLKWDSLLTWESQLF